MTIDDDTEPGPAQTVWSRLQEGLELSREDFARRFEGHTNDPTYEEAFAEALLSFRTGIIVHPEAFDVTFAEVKTTFELPEDVAALMAQFSDITRMVIGALAVVEPSNWDPDTRHAVELRLAERGLTRLKKSMDRLATLQPLLIKRRIPEKAVPYVTELSDMFLLGFDVGVIALACSTFEQLAKSALIALGHKSEPQIRKERPSAESLIVELRRANLLSTTSADSARRLVDRRNTILHQFMSDARILPTMSRDSISDLLDIAADLSPSWPTTGKGGSA